MLVYKVFPDVPDRDRDVNTKWFRTRTEAHAAAKEQFRLDPMIVMVDVDVTHAGVVSILSGRPQQVPKKAWSLTSRKGLKEVPLSEVPGHALRVDAPTIVDVEVKRAPAPLPALNPSYVHPMFNRKAHAEVAIEGRPRDEKNDCAVRAFTIASGLPYKEVWEIARRAGRKFRRGTSIGTLDEMATALGFVKRTVSHVPHQNLAAVSASKAGTLHRLSIHGVGKRIVAIKSRHAMAIVDGKEIDIGAKQGPRCRVLWYYEAPLKRGA